MAAIQAYGGATIVQDPADALSDGMPRAVLELIQPDFVLPASAIGPVVADLARETEPPRTPNAPPAVAPELVAVGPGTREPRESLAVARAALVADPSTLPPALTDLVCPDCGGSLAEVVAGPVTRFRCRVGHVYSPEALFGMKTTELEAGLWAALRTLEESASIAKRLADRSRANGSPTMMRRFQERQNDAAQRADLVRQALQSLYELAENGHAREEVVPALPSHSAGGRATTPG
jgi:two-component system chemotaxis response regulator CheB